MPCSICERGTPLAVAGPAAAGERKAGATAVAVGLNRCAGAVRERKKRSRGRGYCCALGCARQWQKGRKGWGGARALKGLLRGAVGMRGDEGKRLPLHSPRCGTMGARGERCSAPARCTGQREKQVRESWGFAAEPSSAEEQQEHRGGERDRERSESETETDQRGRAGAGCVVQGRAAVGNTG